MKAKWKTVIACFMALALLATLAVGCDEEEEAGKVTIVIGDLSDMTGPAAGPVAPISWILADLVAYVNANDPIEGVELEVIRYDTKYDPARFVSGYQWCRDRGAEILYTPLPEVVEALRALCKADKVPLFCQAGATVPADPSTEWVFEYDPPVDDGMVALMNWIEDEWDYATDGIPEVGIVGWDSVYAQAVAAGVNAVIQADATKFTDGGTYLAAWGTLTWAGPVQALKNCDYVVQTTPGGLQPATFATEFRAAGATGLFLGSDALTGFVAPMVGKVGWAGVDGTIALCNARWPDKTSHATVSLASDLLYANHPEADVDPIMEDFTAGQVPALAVVAGSLIIDITRAAVAAVGAENFDEQAWFDAAIAYTQPAAGGMPAMGFGTADRYALENFLVYEWDAATETLIAAEEWLPVTVTVS